MGPVNIPEKDSMYMQWITNFASVAATNADELGLSAEQVTALADEAALFTERYKASQLAKIKAASAFASKRDSRDSSEELFRAIAKQIKNTDSISDGLKVKMGMIGQKASPSPVVTPTELCVVGDSIGCNILTWHSNGNSRSVAYGIECLPHGESYWRLIKVTSTTKFVHSNQLPGIPVSYRVFAQRSNRQSPCTPAVTVYSDLNTSCLAA